MRVLLTGASKGIGAAIARELAPDVDAMVLAARSTELLEKVTAECEAINPACAVRPHTFDVTSEAEVREIMDLTLAEVPLLEEVTAILLMAWMHLGEVDHLFLELHLGETLVHKKIVLLVHGTVATLASSGEDLESTTETMK